MPSKSRKKMKGQARKAKAKAAAANNEANNSCQQLRRRHVTNSILSDGTMQSLPNDTPRCKHGFEEVYSQFTQVCGQFINTFFQTFTDNISRMTETWAATKLTTDALSEAYNKFPEAVNIESNREILKKNFISNGVSSLLGTLGPDNSAVMSHGCVVALLLIDSYHPSSRVPPGCLDQQDPKVWLRHLDIINGCKRSLVKHFVKQISCKCLDELYAQVKSTTVKMGLCFGCKQKKERNTLFICTGCERVQFCSKACQLTFVPKHKDIYKFWQDGTLPPYDE